MAKRHRGLTRIIRVARFKSLKTGNDILMRVNSQGTLPPTDQERSGGVIRPAWWVAVEVPKDKDWNAATTAFRAFMAGEGPGTMVKAPGGMLTRDTLERSQPGNAMRKPRKTDQVPDAEVELTQALEEAYRRAGREVGYWGNYFLRSLRANGGVATAKKLLSDRRGVSKGFQALIDAGRPDLSVEAVILGEPRFARLFTPEEIAAARRRLDEFPGPRERTRVPTAEVFPEVLPTVGPFKEGAVRKVTVNYYERDPKARRACLAKHTTRCAVCAMSFEERYGPRGAGIIHVHHKKPLATRRGAYELDPVNDLVPVCPNCHTMLHTVDPPLSVHELRREMSAVGS